MMYFDPMITYQREHFQKHYDVVDNSFPTIFTEDWLTNLNIGVDTFTFCMTNHSYQVHIFNVLLELIHQHARMFSRHPLHK
jgi:preprotein translocase subunit SecB